MANTLGALSRDDLRRCRIPRMPLAEQRRYGGAFRRQQDWRALTALAKVSTNVIDQTIRRPDHRRSVAGLSAEEHLKPTQPKE